MFIAQKQYTKNDLYAILKVPVELQRGAWDTGMRIYNDDCFVFANIGVAGRTGHNYNNHWEGDNFIWYGNTTSKLTHSSIQKLLNPETTVFIFSRTDSSIPFTYQGIGKVIKSRDTSPVEVTWAIESNLTMASIPEEVVSSEEALFEGHTVKIWVNKYERNINARKKCIEHFDCRCFICGFNFEDEYGSHGKDFIHVHHLIPLSKIKKKYMVDPIKDLIPVCPNCHAMLHKGNSMYSVKEIKSLLRKK